MRAGTAGGDRFQAVTEGGFCEAIVVREYCLHVVADYKSCCQVNGVQ